MILTLRIPSAKLRHRDSKRVLGVGGIRTGKVVDRVAALARDV